MKIFIVVIIIAAVGLVYYIATKNPTTRGTTTEIRNDVNELGQDAKRGVEEGIDATKRTTQDAVDAVKKTDK